MTVRAARLLATGLAACAGALAVASSASAAGPPSISPGDGRFWNAASPTPVYTITGDTADAVIDWSASNGGGGTLIGGGTVILAGATEGPGTLTATQFLPFDPVAGSDTREFTVDRIAPKVTGSTRQPATPNGANGWYTVNVTVSFQCSADSVSCGPTRTLSGNRAGQTVTGTARDAAGNTDTLTTGGINIDKTAPGAASPQSPANGAVVAQVRPTFTWGAATDPSPGSSLQRYELVVDNAVVATVPAAAARSAQPGSPLSARGHTWLVRTRDVAGNARDGARRSFTLDPSTPPAPTITAGPRGATNTKTHSFSWTGSGPKYSWQLVRNGVTSPVQKSAAPGTATSAALAPLADGTYTFTVVQINVAGTTSAGASRTFTVDTVSPGPLTITGRPPSPTSSPTPSFSWTGAEPASVVTWQVLGPGGGGVQGAAAVLGSSATVGPLSPGAYTFQVRQTDAAGNAGPPAPEAFSIVAGPPGAAKPAGARAKLPTRNATRLRPRAGKRLLSTRPLLSWKPGPRRTILYNLQIFRVTNPNAKTVKALRLRKINSYFPRGTRARVRGLARGRCYVWRVWPYVGTSFTKQPLGLSNFCIAKRSTPPR